jgi:hypothetical protein
MSGEWREKKGNTRERECGERVERERREEEGGEEGEEGGEEGGEGGERGGERRSVITSPAQIR